MVSRVAMLAVCTEFIANSRHPNSLINVKRSYHWTKTGFEVSRRICRKRKTLASWTAWFYLLNATSNLTCFLTSLRREEPMMKGLEKWSTDHSLPLLFNSWRHGCYSKCSVQENCFIDCRQTQQAIQQDHELAQMLTQFLSSTLGCDVPAWIQIFPPPPHQLLLWRNWPGHGWEPGIILNLSLKTALLCPCHFSIFHMCSILSSLYFLFTASSCKKKKITH